VSRLIHPIEQRSYAIMRSRVDTAALPPWTRAVVERVVHASADLDYVRDLVCEEAALAAAAQALRAGVPVVADVQMVAAGITVSPVVCRVAEAAAAALAAAAGITRSAAGVRLAAAEVGPGAIWVVGCAPTALTELLRLDVRPALVVGMPVGFVGAVEAKQALRTSGLPAVSNVSAKGGSAVAAAAVNALRYGPNGEGCE
jgi:precorrin-8X/cobalt-precorrin-8 methylmutase